MNNQSEMQSDCSLSASFTQMTISLPLTFRQSASEGKIIGERSGAASAHHQRGPIVANDMHINFRHWILVLELADECRLYSRCEYHCLLNYPPLSSDQPNASMPHTLFFLSISRAHLFVLYPRYAATLLWPSLFCFPTFTSSSVAQFPRLQAVSRLHGVTNHHT